MDKKQQDVLMKHYAAVNSIVNMIASRFSRKYASSAGRKEMFDEFRSFAWLQVVLAMSRYDEGMGCSVTSFLWSQIWGRVARYVPTYLAMRRMDEIEPNVMPEASLVEDGENWKNTWHADPWRCRPDQVLEYKERMRLRRRLYRYYGNDMRDAYAVSECEQMSNAERQKMFRRRQRMVSEMRMCLGRDRGYFSKYRSDVNLALTASQVFQAVTSKEEEAVNRYAYLDPFGNDNASQVCRKPEMVRTQDKAVDGAVSGCRRVVQKCGMERHLSGVEGDRHASV
ncbi:MAG: hypothetical protein IIY06_10445 [Proteobacteria bacterium]|nr:hypothetical protein [Pseudomonadota bacterium]